MLALENLRVSYDGVPALTDMSLRVAPGQIVALVGGNGNGKSTTLRAAAGLNALDGGSIVFDGRPVHALPAHERVPLGLCLVPEGRRLFPKLTVRRNLELGAYTRADKPEIAADVDRMFELFPILKERATQLAGTMSGGEQQMLAIGRGLMAEPKLLILDEPSLGLSPLLVEEMFTLIRQLRDDGLAVLLVEQNVGQSLEIADRAYVLENGSVRFSGMPDELLATPELRRAYLGI